MKVSAGCSVLKSTSGHLHTIGHLGSRGGADQMRRVESLKEHFIEDFTCAKRFIVALTADGSIFHIDQYLAATPVRLRDA